MLAPATGLGLKLSARRERPPNKALQLTPNSWPQSRPGGILAAAAQPQRWRSALFGAAERRSVGLRTSDKNTRKAEF